MSHIFKDALIDALDFFFRRRPPFDALKWNEVNIPDGTPFVVPPGKIYEVRSIINDVEGCTELLAFGDIPIADTFLYIYIPDGERWKVESIVLGVNTSAVVGNRLPIIEVTIDNFTAFSNDAASAVTAGTDINIRYLPSQTIAEVISGNNRYNYLQNDMVLKTNDWVYAEFQNMKAADVVTVYVYGKKLPFHDILSEGQSISVPNVGAGGTVKILWREVASR